MWACDITVCDTYLKWVNFGLVLVRLNFSVTVGFWVSFGVIKSPAKHEAC